MPLRTDNRSSERSYITAPREVVINGKTFHLNDMGFEGFGVIVESEGTLFLGQRLSSIKLVTGGRSKILKGIVSHITRTEHHIICGIRFEFSGPEDLIFITEFKKTISHQRTP